MKTNSDFWETFWSITPMLLFAIAVAVLICCAPSVDKIVFGR